LFTPSGGLIQEQVWLLSNVCECGLHHDQRLDPFLPMDDEAYGADWAVVGPQRRVVIPNSVASHLSWIGKETSEMASVQLTAPGRLILRPLSRVEPTLRLARERIKEDHDDAECLRRIAFSHHIFRQTLTEGRAKRLKLRPAVLRHLGVSEGEELFCLAYSDQLEIMNKEQYARLFAEFGEDLAFD
jgi:hypothetical protein